MEVAAAAAAAGSVGPQRERRSESELIKARRWQTHSEGRRGKTDARTARNKRQSFEESWSRTRAEEELGDRSMVEVAMGRAEAATAVPPLLDAGLRSGRVC